VDGEQIEGTDGDPTLSFKKPFRATPVKLGQVYQRRVHQARRRQTLRTVSLYIAALLVGAGMGIARFGLPGLFATTPGDVEAHLRTGQTGVSRTFILCETGPRFNCVVDGDTIWMDGIKIRMVDIDAPETHPPRCEHEAVLGNRATNRLLELVNAGPIVAEPSGGRDKDRNGRELRLLMQGGRSLGDILISEGLARQWDGRRHPWC
jgi:endonuclease YncB( thermonuclease family)